MTKRFVSQFPPRQGAWTVDRDWCQPLRAAPAAATAIMGAARRSAVPTRARRGIARSPAITSHAASTKGSAAAEVFEREARRNAPAAPHAGPRSPRRTARRWSTAARSAKTALRRSFRAEAQATTSAWRGWTAHSSAPARAAPGERSASRRST